MTDLVSTEVSTAAGSGVRFLARSNRRYLLLSAIGAVLAAAALIDMTTGPGNLAIRTVIETILDKGAHGVPMEVIVWDIRLPIALMAVLVGAMLGAAGAEMQTILNNPLADPFTLGISSAASFGAAIAIVLQINLIPIAGPFLVTANAFVLAVSTSFEAAMQGKRTRSSQHRTSSKYVPQSGRSLAIWFRRSEHAKKRRS